MQWLRSLSHRPSTRGANSTRSQARALIALEKRPQTKTEQMLYNNYLSMQWIRNNSSLSITSELIVKIHENISQNTLQGDDANFCGKFRDNTVFVGSHQGVPHEKIVPALQEVIPLVTKHPRFISDLIKSILLHYFIAYIHPFFDGNGRTARTLFYFQAMKSHLPFVQLLSISANLREHGRKYEKSFDLVKEYEWDMTFFIDFSLDSLLLALGKVGQKIDYLIAIANYVKEKKMGLNENQTSLLQKMALNKHRSISIEQHASRIKKSREKARRELKDLWQNKFLIEKKQGKKLIYFIDSKRLKREVSQQISPS